MKRKVSHKQARREAAIRVDETHANEPKEIERVTRTVACEVHRKQAEKPMFASTNANKWTTVETIAGAAATQPAKDIERKQTPPTSVAHTNKPNTDFPCASRENKLAKHLRTLQPSASKTPA
uniref:RVT_N domain-containing protein n=1 Tax=Ascaris lumbricoides TaxID=6252 RepID=A0A0M3ICB2_ASCLU